MQCGAKTRSGAPCNAKPMANGRCRMHGGTARAGVASGTFKTGRYSKYLPTRLAARYEETKDDPDLLSLHDDIRLLDVRLSEVVERISDDDPRALWGKAEAALEQYKEAQQSGSRKQATAMMMLESIIAEGIEQADGATWREAFAILEQRRKLVESESKRQQMLQQMIPTESALLLIGLIERTIRTHVTDPTILAAIGRDITKLTAVAPRAIIDAERG